MSLGTYLNGGTIAQLRGLAFLSLSDSGIWIQASGTTGDSGGGRGSITWGTAGTLPCRLDPLVGSENVVADRLNDRSTHQITLPPATAITTDDRIVIDSNTYEVTALRDRTAESLRVIEAVKLSP